KREFEQTQVLVAIVEGNPAVVLESVAVLFVLAGEHHLFQVRRPMVKVLAGGQSGQPTVSGSRAAGGTVGEPPLLIALVANDAAVVAAFDILDARDVPVPMDSVGAG